MTKASSPGKVPVRVWRLCRVSPNTSARSAGWKSKLPTFLIDFFSLHIWKVRADARVFIFEQKYNEKQFCGFIVYLFRIISPVGKFQTREIELLFFHAKACRSRDRFNLITYVNSRLSKIYRALVCFKFYYRFWRVWSGIKWRRFVFFLI